MGNTLQTLPEEELQQKTPALQTQQAEKIPRPQPQTPQPLYSGLEIKNQPTVPDYLEEAQKVLKSQAEAAQEQMKIYTQDLGEDVARSVYGRNVGAESGIGKEIVGRAIRSATDRFAPYLADISGRMSERGLKYYEDTIRRDQELQDERRKFETQFGNINPDTGQPWTSQQEADLYWSKKATTTATQTAYGDFNPDTGQKFGSEAEARLYWAGKEREQTATQEQQYTYGTNPETNQPFQSTMEANLYWANKETQSQLANEFGENPSTGQAFLSSMEAKQFWDDKITNSNAARTRSILYGTNPITGKPFESDNEAKNYWEEMTLKNDFIREMSQKYGTNPRTKKPFDNLLEAEKYGKQEQFKQTMKNEYGDDPTTNKPFQSIRQAEEYMSQRKARMSTLFEMAINGQVKSEDVLGKILGEYGLKPGDISIPEAREQTIEAYINAKLANDQPINMDELNSILGVTDMEKIENKDMVLKSPTFARSILATEDEALQNYLVEKGFEKETKFKGDFLGIKFDDYWQMKESKKNFDLFKKLYAEDAEFRDYMNNFLS